MRNRGLPTGILNVAKRSTTPSDEKLERTDFDLFDALAAIDRKDYKYWSTLTHEQQKKFVPYLLCMWASSVSGTSSLQQYYLLATNENANKYLLNERISGHPELQWMMLCAASPGVGRQRHNYIPHLSDKFANLRERATKKDIAEYLKKTDPNADSDTVNTVAIDWANTQNHQYRLAQMYPEMKLQDLVLLATMITHEDIDEYERQSGY